MPTQTRSSHKKANKGKGSSFSYQDNSFYVEDPVTNKPLSLGIPIFYQPLSPTMFGARQERQDVKHNTYDNLSTHATDSDSSSSSSEASEPTKKCYK